MLNTEMTTQAEQCSHPYLLSQAQHYHHSSRCRAQSLPNTHRCCLVQTVYYHKVHRALQSTLSLSIVMSVIYSKFLDLSSPLWCPNSELIYAWGAAALNVQEQRLGGASPSSLTQWGGLRCKQTKGMSKGVQEYHSTSRSQPAANSHYRSCSCSRESCTTEHRLNCWSFNLKCTIIIETEMNYIASGQKLTQYSPGAACCCAAGGTSVAQCSAPLLTTWGDSAL